MLHVAIAAVMLAQPQAEIVTLFGEGISPNEPADQFGVSVASNLDLNADGITDIAVAAFGAPRVYVFFGPIESDRHASDADIIISALGVNPSPLSIGPDYDVNGDGIDDLAIGARNGGEGVLGGQVWVFHGPLTEDGTIEHGGLGDADATIIGDNFFELGRAIASADVNLDGTADMLIGASQSGAGKALVYFGPVSGVMSMNDADTTIDGVLGFENFGDAVSIGDVSADGVPDLIIGAEKFALGEITAGRTYVFHGPVAPGHMTANQADTVINGESLNDGFGFDVAMAGDVDGDGLDDLLVGAEQLFNDGNGKAYLFLSPIAEGALSAANAEAIFDSEPGGISNRFGFVSAAGDINGDGMGDIVIGAPDAGFLDGRVYFHEGPIAGTIDPLSADLILTGPAGFPIDRLGTSLASAGDLDANGVDDVIVGAPGFEGPGFAQILMFQGACAADCNGDDALDVLDFVCFQGEWLGQTSTGDCDANGVHDILDFICFQSVFQGGCD